MKPKNVIISIVIAYVVISSAHAQIAAMRVASGVGGVLFVTAPPNDTGRLFIVRQNGLIHILNLGTGKLNATPFINIGPQIVVNAEQGLLGMAFDPDYATNGKFYLDFTVPGGFWGRGTTHVSQFQVSANPDVADPTETVLLTFDHPQITHNGGWIAFSARAGDDHNLYISTGDGGSRYDKGFGHIEPGGNAQSLTTLLGKMLRVHVDPAGSLSIPPDNPFFGSATARQEIWLYGLRNPWRNSFDPATGTLFIADVGEATFEELDVQNGSGGQNYEWRLREGTVATPFPTGGPEPPNGVQPIFEYDHTVGQCITGGYVYRGSAIPSLQGIYVFADYLGAEAINKPKVFTINPDGTNFTDITAQLFPTKVGHYTLFHPASLGEDANHELYICAGTNVFKIVPDLPPGLLRK
jgi:glucose/arabinose dehydrogenase